jgi:hypothetical protein
MQVNLKSNRIYQTGEVLAKLRKYSEQFPKSSSSCNPIVRTVVLDAWRGPDSVQMHSMAELASQTAAGGYGEAS